MRSGLSAILIAAIPVFPAGAHDWYTDKVDR